MKKEILFLIMIVCSTSLVFAIQLIGDILEVELVNLEVELVKDKGGISYTEVVDKNIIGFETVYKNESYQLGFCDYVDDNGTNKTTCHNETFYRKVVDIKTKGDAIYSYDSPKAIKYGTDTYNFDSKGCFVCSSVNVNGTSYEGNLLLCLSKKDGFSEYRASEFKCVLRSGESGKIINLQNKGVVYESSDVGKI